MDKDTSKIIEAIQNRRQISVLYLKPDKPYGYRTGNPYALYVHPSTKNMILDFWQTGGVSGQEEPIPGWRRYSLQFISEASIINPYAPFPIVPGYNENSVLYNFKCLAKVKTK